MLCPLHLPSFHAWILDSAISLVWQQFLLPSVRECAARRTQVAGGKHHTACVCVLPAINACSMQSLDDIYGPY